MIADNLVISGIAADNSAIARVEFQFDNDAWQIASGTTACSASLNSARFYRVQAR